MHTPSCGLRFADETSFLYLQVLEDYDNMLTHLSKELAQVRADFEAWEKPEEAEKKRKAKEEEEKEKKKKEGSSGT